MGRFRKAVVACTLGVTVAAGASLAAAPAAFACNHNANFTFSSGNWFAPSQAQWIYAIYGNDCDYVSEKAEYSDYFEAFLTTDEKTYHAAGEQLVTSR